MFGAPGKILGSTSEGIPGGIAEEISGRILDKLPGGFPERISGNKMSIISQGVFI